MEIRWLDDALADIAGIYRHVAHHDPRAAARVVERLHASVRTLRQMPQRGRPGCWPGTRELVIPRRPYIIPYRVGGDVIEILRVFHAARRWPDEALG